MSEKAELKQLYTQLLSALQGYSNARTLSKSPLIKSCLVQSRIDQDISLSPAESLRLVIDDLLVVLDKGSESSALLLHQRFRQGLTINDICDHHNPHQFAMRTIQQKQKEAIQALADWFYVKEQHCANYEPNLVRPSLIRYSNQYKIPIDPKAISYCWKSFGGANATAVAIEEGDNLFLNFPHIDSSSDLDMVYQGKDFAPPYRISTKLTFKENQSDRAGFIIGWQHPSRLIRLQLNIYWCQLELFDYVTATLKNRIKVPLQQSIDVDKPLWLQAEVREKYLQVGLSSDGHEFDIIYETNKIELVRGFIGLSTSGPNLPHTHFHQLHVETFDREIE